MIVEFLAAGKSEAEVVAILVASGFDETEARWAVEIETGRAGGDNLIVDAEGNEAVRDVPMVTPP